MMAGMAYFASGQQLGFGAVHGWIAGTLSTTSQVALGAGAAAVGALQGIAGALAGAGARAVPYAPHACSLVRSGLAENVLGQEAAVRDISSAVCDHLRQIDPRGPLVLSLHGPPGVGKSLTHRTLALSLWGVPPSSRQDCPGKACPGYYPVFGVNYTPSSREEQWARLYDSLVQHLRAHPNALVVVEEYDR